MNLVAFTPPVPFLFRNARVYRLILAATPPESVPRCFRWFVSPRCLAIRDAANAVRQASRRHGTAIDGTTR
jgi:hypothetical protein